MTKAPVPPRYAELCALLDTRQISYGYAHDVLTVHRSLDLSDRRNMPLPEGVTITGNLFITKTRCTTLPRRLVVQEILMAGGSAIREIPDDIVLGGSLWLNNSKILRLPDNLRVHGMLNLENTKIAQLPENLFVQENLHAYETRILRLPAGLRVGGRICPPTRLQDINAFMQTQPEKLVVIHPAQSQHERMQHVARFQGFPDLMTVVDSIPPDSRMVVARWSRGQCPVHFTTQEV